MDRAESLAAAIQADIAGNPNGAFLTRDATELARLADAFHDSSDANQPVEVAARAFGTVDAIADRLERFVTTKEVSPRLQNAWQAFASVEVLIHQNLGLDSPQPRVQVSLVPTPGSGTPPLAARSNELVEQISAFVQVYSRTAGNIPEGGAILANAERFQAAAAAFRQNAARGLPPNQLAYAFQDVDVLSQRLARRVNRIAQGRVGPNLQQVQRVVGTCAQIHRVLGMPGYPRLFIPLEAIPAPRGGGSQSVSMGGEGRTFPLPLIVVSAFSVSSQRLVGADLPRRGRGGRATHGSADS